MSAFPQTAYPAGRLFPITVDMYHQMIDAGILDEKDPVELLEGGVGF